VELQKASDFQYLDPLAAVLVIRELFLLLVGFVGQGLLSSFLGCFKKIMLV
jgi:hypothetical protein